MFKKRGYVGVAIYHPKTSNNVGSLWRTAHLLGVNFFATIGKRYRYQSSDTTKASRHIPLFEFESFEQFKANCIPYDCQLIAVELDPNAIDLKDFAHPERAVYLFGAEDYGIPKEILSQCHKIVKLKGEASMNLACCGSIVLYDRLG